MEKIIFNSKELEVSSLSNVADSLEIRFIKGDFGALELAFANPADLEKIILADAQGKPMAVFKNYSVLQKLVKEKKVVIDELNDQVADVVVVFLTKEPEWSVAQRKQNELLSSLAETTDKLVMESLI